MPSPAVAIRPAVESDIPLILTLIRELAEYERLTQELTATEERLRQTLFGPRPAAEALLAFVDDAPAGYAVFFQNYSTFVARPGLYLEDLFVRPAVRSHGIGRALLARLASIARERGCAHIEWVVLDWNEPAIGFYKALGAKPMSGWSTFRLAGESLQKLTE